MQVCRRLTDSATNAVYFLLVSVHKDETDLEHGSHLDVDATDGQLAWRNKGKRREARLGKVLVNNSVRACCVAGIKRPNTQVADWMATATRALTLESEDFTFIITRKKQPELLRASNTAADNTAGQECVSLISLCAVYDRFAGNTFKEWRAMREN